MTDRSRAPACGPDHQHCRYEPQHITDHPVTPNPCSSQLRAGGRQSAPPTNGGHEGRDHVRRSGPGFPTVPASSCMSIGVEKGPSIGMEKGPLLIIGSGSSPESIGGCTCGPPGVNRGRGSAGGEARRLGTARSDTLACLERSSLEGQSRPKPRGGATLSSSERSSSQIAWRASASALSCWLAGSASSQSAYCACSGIVFNEPLKGGHDLLPLQIGRRTIDLLSPKRGPVARTKRSHRTLCNTSGARCARVG